MAALPGHTEGLGDARHRQMVDHQARQCPAHRRTRELRARIGRLTHVLTPHVSTRLAPVAAHAHMQDRGTPPAGLMRQAPDHRVTTNALAPAASTPPVLTSNTARQHCMVCLNALTRHPQPQAIQAREHAQIRAIKDSTWACRGLSDGRCRNPHHRKTSTPTRPRHAQPRPQHLHPQMRRATKVHAHQSPTSPPPRSSSSMPAVRMPEGRATTATPMSEEIMAMARPTSEVG